jgi:proteasome lid subunit RPN8/RPN11
MSSYVLSKKDLIDLHKRAYRAQQEGHREVCGIVTANANNELRLWFLDNKSEKPYEYSLDPSDIADVEKEAETLGEQAIASFHSHPVTEARPGQGDIARGFFNGMELIYDVCAREAKVWQIEGNEDSSALKEVPLVVR